MSVSAADRHGTVLAPAESYLEVGYNYRMTDLQAAIGIVQLSRLPEIVQRRRELAEAYTKQIDEIPWPSCSRRSSMGKMQLSVILAGGGHDLSAISRRTIKPAGQR